MKSDTIARLSDRSLLEARTRHFDRLRAVYSGKSLEQVFVVWGILGESGTDPYADPEQWVEDCLDSLADDCLVLLDSNTFRPLVVEYGIYGVRFIDKLLGADPYLKDGNWWSDGLDRPVGALAYPDLAGDETWCLARRAARKFASSGAKAVLFGLPTIASALNVAVNLYGERFLAAALATPEAARHDLFVINRLLYDLHAWYLDTLPLEQLQPVIAFQRTQPPGYGQLCGCSTHLVSAELYEDFLAPLDRDLLSVYPRGGMIHLCGAHTQHISVWRRMEELRAVQLNDRASEDLEAYSEGLREDQVIYLNPTETMTAERAVAITGGRRLVVVADLNDPIALPEG